MNVALAPRTARGHDSPWRRGSALVPVVAAMLILLLMGISLAEMFGAMQAQSVTAADSTRAYRIAEAGLWHSVHDAASIPTPVAFGGGSYTAIRVGDEYTAVGSMNQATRQVTKTVLPSGGPAPSIPIDEAASAAGVADNNRDDVWFPLVSVVPEDLVIEAFQLSADVPTAPLHRVRLDGAEIYHQHSGEPLPTGILSIVGWNVRNRTITGFDSPTLLFEMRVNPIGDVTYTVVLYFTNGTTSTILFKATW